METKEITKAIISVMKVVKGMEKNSKVGTGGSSYNGTKDQDVKEVFNEALVNAGLCIVPIDIEEHTQVDRWEEQDPYKPTVMKTKQSVFTKVKTKYLLLHESGESLELCGYGHGVDSQDKGAGKATTYALKNCLLYTFLTPVGKIDDTDTTHSDEINAPKVKLSTTADVLPLITNAANRDAVAAIWTNNVHLQKDQIFKNAITNKGNEFKDPKEVSFENNK